MGDISDRSDISDFSNVNEDVKSFNLEPTKLIDELSTTEFYVGTSKSFRDTSKANWQIKKIWKSGNVWHSGFPNGDQEFKYIWNSRLTYTYP